MTARKPNPTAASLLGFLHEGPMSGWDLAATAETVIGDFWSLTRSQVYRELAWMADAGLVEAGERGARDRRAYTITEHGRQAFADWMAREPGPGSIRIPLLLAVNFGRHLDPEDLAALLERHRQVHAARLQSYEQSHEAALAGGAADPFALATLEFGLAYERAVLGWFDRLPELLERPQRAGPKRP